MLKTNRLKEYVFDENYWWHRWMSIYSMRIHNIWRWWGSIWRHNVLQIKGKITTG